MCNDVKRVRKQPVGERVVHQESRYCQQMGITRMCDAIALECTKVIGIAQLRSQLLEDGPIELFTLVTDFLLEMLFQISRDPIIVQECVVDIEQENDDRRWHAISSPRITRLLSRFRMFTTSTPL